jgi:hypothetical protein
VSLNLHSDSGNYRHCGYYYDDQGTVSEWLGRGALAEAVKHCFRRVGAMRRLFRLRLRAVGAARRLPGVAKDGRSHDASRCGIGAGPRPGDCPHADEHDGWLFRHRYHATAEYERVGTVRGLEPGAAR